MAYEYDIFISHSSSDALQARLIRGYMRSHNLDCWLDNTNMRPSEPIDDMSISSRVGDALRRSRYLLLVLSKEALGSDWVKREVEYALKLRREDHHKLEIVAVTVEDLDLSTKPDWLTPVRVIDIGGALARIDVLRDLRDEIGEPKPTYISDVKPSFVKHTPVGRLTEHLRKCDFDSIKIWFINGGFSVQQHILPAVRTALEDLASSRKKLEAQVLLVDSAHFPGNGLPTPLNDPHGQNLLDERLRISKFFPREGRHETLLRQTAARLRDLDEAYDKFSVEIRLTPQIPAGRIIIAGEFGFFSPYIQEYDSDLPVLIFDRKSPFFSIAERYFDMTFRTARPFPSE